MLLKLLLMVLESSSQLQDKVELPVTHTNNFPTNKQLETSNNRASSMAQVEDAGIQTDFVDLQTREKELNRLVFLLQVPLANSQKALHEQQHRQQSNNLTSVIRKSDQSQQTELFPPCLPVPAVFKDVITEQPTPALPPLVYPQPSLSSQLPAYPPSNIIHPPLNSVNTTMDLATSMTTTVSAVSTLRERLQVSFGTSTERTNLISAAFIHRLKQRVQQRREENALNGIRRMNGNGESSEEDEYEFQQGRRIKTRKLRGSSLTRKMVPDVNRQSILNSTVTSPKLSTSLAALSLRSSPPPPPAPFCANKHLNHQHASISPSKNTLKSLCLEAEDLIPLTTSGSLFSNSNALSVTNSASASLKRKVNFADRVQKEGIGSQPSNSRSLDENENTVPKIKPAIKKGDNTKDNSDPVTNGKRPMSQRSVAFVDEIDTKSISDPDKDV
ncbi:unnamed protein product [Hymenolepis diminuta]|uniref:Uncharacterized protein n=1 Tax=Hymenolepis diminuta TaxID=6216 RepID=A0A158QEB6_HYMDI|nr:unnamed protein product [Hymenolepis diminuta]